MLRLLLLIATPLLVDAAVAYALAESPHDSTMQVSTVFFDWDQPDLSDHARTTLAKAASAGHATRIVLQAADGMGIATAYGSALSQARWRSVMTELSRDGVAPDKITRVSPSIATLRPDTPS